MNNQTKKKKKSNNFSLHGGMELQHVTETILMRPQPTPCKKNNTKKKKIAYFVNFQVRIN